MKIKKVIDIYGNEVEIDEDTRKVSGFSNKKHKVTYNAQIVSDGTKQKFWTDYTEEGTVDDIDAKIRIWNSKLYLIYASNVGFKSSDNDPDGEKFRLFCDYVKNNQDKFFDNFGDYKKDFLISDKEIKSILV